MMIAPIAKIENAPQKPLKPLNDIGEDWFTRPLAAQGEAEPTVAMALALTSTVQPSAKVIFAAEPSIETIRSPAFRVVAPVTGAMTPPRSIATEPCSAFTCARALAVAEACPAKHVRPIAMAAAYFVIFMSRLSRLG